jgi:hypothetical protein
MLELNESEIFYDKFLFIPSIIYGVKSLWSGCF